MLKCCLILVLPLSALTLCQACQPSAGRGPLIVNFLVKPTLCGDWWSQSPHCIFIKFWSPPLQHSVQPPHQLDWFLIHFKIPQSSALNIVTTGPSKSLVKMRQDTFDLVVASGGLVVVMGCSMWPHHEYLLILMDIRITNHILTIHWQFGVWFLWV